MVDKERISRIEELLVASHCARPEIAADSDWNRHVMTRIRAGRTEAKEGEGTLALQRTVWRFAAVACAFALFVSSYGFAKGITPVQLAAAFFIGDPSGAAAMLILPL